MKTSITYVLIVITMLAFSNDSLTEQVKELKKSIACSNRVEKLGYMDSPSQSIRYKKAYHYDFIIKATINYAYELNVSDMVLTHISELMSYLTNRSGKLEEAQRIFDDFGSQGLTNGNYGFPAKLYVHGTENHDFRTAALESKIVTLDKKNHVKRQWLFFGGFGLFLLVISIYFWRSQYSAKRKQKLQREFTQGLIKGQEEERLRIARELHDGVGQKLVLLKKKLSCKRQHNMEHLCGEILDELRSILKALHPEVLGRLGITKALKALIHEADKNSNIFFTADIEDIDHLVTAKNALHLYRIVQEALNNIIKHSEAKSVSITVRKKCAGIKATIKDNGTGFTITEKLRKEGSLGMKTLMERAKIMESSIHILTEPDKGTSIKLTIPF
ncbi:sensor histidine kinase [Winogradskyella sp.]|uniref:sensor histidine kinase n=1 Tax=Winogradskyella sp. TaxID=1883156 RepID=UPI003BABB5E2